MSTKRVGWWLTVDDERLDFVGLDLELLLQELERQLLAILGQRHEGEDAHLVYVLLVAHGPGGDRAFVRVVELHVLVELA